MARGSGKNRHPAEIRSSAAAGERVGGEGEVEEKELEIGAAAERVEIGEIAEVGDLGEAERHGTAEGEHGAILEGVHRGGVAPGKGQQGGASGVVAGDLPVVVWVIAEIAPRTGDERFRLVSPADLAERIRQR